MEVLIRITDQAKQSGGQSREDKEIQIIQKKLGKFLLVRQMILYCKRFQLL